MNEKKTFKTINEDGKKCNISVSDIVQQVQLFDYSELLEVLKPIIILFVTNKVTNIGLKTYALNKEFKAKGVSTIDLPPEVTRIYCEVDKEKILQQQFGDAIINFATTITEKIPDVDLTLFYNNLNTLTASTKNFRFTNMLLKSTIRGTYNSSKNDIRLEEDNYRLSIDHELFHMASTYYRKKDDMVFAGFSQRTKTKKSIGRGINEGYTQLLTERYFGEEKLLLRAYQYEKIIAKKLEIIIGKEKMESLYLNANLYGLIQELSHYEEEKKVIQFFADVDFLEKNLTDKHVLPLEKNMIITKLRNVNQFLLECYIKKLKVDFSNTDLTEEELRSKLVAFMIMMGQTIKIGKTQYELTSLDEIIEIIFKILKELEGNKKDINEHQINQLPVSKGK